MAKATKMYASIYIQLENIHVALLHLLYTFFFTVRTGQSPDFKY